MNKHTALILFAHGARDPRWAAPFQRLQKMTQESLPDCAVELAFLEFMTPSLPELVSDMVAKGIQKITVSPIFLGQGGHVLRDLPILIEQLNVTYPDLDMQLATAVGEQESVLLAIRDYCVSLA
ncbi:CbiX/SirB N-terminal domain-containing protein [Undibacterium jejuense]|uniref:CbiX/SirB N-terminal domain-containing protein n=1 Tax=Undibacterium jejuense TaxID=1344949 RepID=A0A923HPR5_9BURK|nr:CbiX/SirB N-terminal domain-containing protein [Undibacterium jejuense]MBC3863451.1 CbiX/SirB N-terminal domain-containing protein [Undibacterium jejuense]